MTQTFGGRKTGGAIVRTDAIIRTNTVSESLFTNGTCFRHAVASGSFMFKSVVFVFGFFVFFFLVFQYIE